MSGAVLTGVAAHDAVVLSAEQQRQQSIATTAAAYAGESGPQILSDLTALQKASDIAYARAMLKSAIANGISPSIWISQLYELGVGGQ